MSAREISRVRGSLIAAATMSIGLTGTVLMGGAQAAHGPQPTGAAVRARTGVQTQQPLDGRIVYINFDAAQVETSNPDGTAVVQVTSTPDLFPQHPQWLPPDDSRIVFVSGVNGDVGLYVVNADGTGQRRLFTDKPGFNDWTPAPTPDGRRVLFGRCRPDPPGGCALFSARLDGTGLRALTPYEADRGDFWPDVAPRGHRVAFTRFGGRRGIAAQTWVMRLDGTHAHPVTPPRLEAARPQWLPGGRRLLLTSSWQHPGSNVFRMRADGSHRRWLTATRWPHNSSAATPSPSGRRIALVNDQAYPDLQGFDLFVMRSDGSGQHRIRTGSYFLGDWGSAPLLPASAATPRRDRAPTPSPHQRAAADRKLSRWLAASRWSAGDPRVGTAS